MECFLGFILCPGWAPCSSLEPAIFCHTTCSSWSPVRLSMLHPSEGGYSCFSFNLGLLDQSFSSKSRSQLGFELQGLIKLKELSPTLLCLHKSSGTSTPHYIARELFSEVGRFPELYLGATAQVLSLLESFYLKEVYCPFPYSSPNT